MTVIRDRTLWVDSVSSGSRIATGDSRPVAVIEHPEWGGRIAAIDVAPYNLPGERPGGQPHGKGTMTSTLHTTLVFERKISARAESVFAAFAQPAKRGEWGTPSDTAAVIYDERTFGKAGKISSAAARRAIRIFTA
jgi:hypothetical protein